MFRFIQRSISNKLMVVVMATTFIALLTYGLVMLIYDVRTYHESVIKDLTTQASIIAEISAPAIEFDDPATARENLELLRTRPSILRSAIYLPDGPRFAEYISRNDQSVTWPEEPSESNGYYIERNRISVWQRITKDQQLLGTVYIRARYEVNNRLVSYALMLAGVMGASLGLALLVAIGVRGAVTYPIIAVANAAREVMQSRDFSLRAKKSSEDEIGTLVDAFNDMLSEVERRASALEASNRSLEHEMTVRLAAEDALREADRRKDEFLATLAHELRNPLAPMVSGLQLLQLNNPDASARENTQAVMARQLKQMVRLVDDLLDVSRITTGKLTLVKSRVDLASVMREALESTAPLMDSQKHDLRVKLPPAGTYVNADPTRLAQVFANLLNNAAKYTDPGGALGFATEVEQHQVTITVADNGIGIAPEMRETIFSMFTQVDQSLERAHSGLGVGLALAKHLVHLHGGTLSVQSQGIGHGSRFAVQLQLAEQLPNAMAEPAPSIEQPAGSKRILLVDDNKDYVLTMAQLLSALGHDVRTAHDGTRAIELATSFKPEFAFMDIGMPEMNGYDLARRLRQLPQTANCIFVAVTGWGQERDRELSQEAGFNYHLVKPVQLAEVEAILDAATEETKKS